MKTLIISFVQCLLYTNYVLPSSVSLLNTSEVKLFETPVAYDVETTVFLNDIIKKDKEVGYKIKATLNVAPVWADPGSEFLLKFQLLQPRLYLRGKHPNANYIVHGSVWDDHPDTTFYAHWNNGVILNSYLDLKEIPDIINYKKSLISLFQFQIIDGEFNETDISGLCDVMYESISEHVFRKIKLRCLGDEQLWGGEARRLTRYTLGGGALDGAYVDELLLLGGECLGVKARSWHRLTRAPAHAAAPAPAPVPALADALAALPPHLAPAALVPDISHLDRLDDDVELQEAVAAERGWLAAGAAGEGGTADHAAAALRLLPRLRAATAAQVTALLDHPDNQPVLGELVQLVGASGAGAGAGAVAGAARPVGEDGAPQLAARYLAGLALAPRPQPPAVRAALHWWRAARDPGVRGAALLAASAAAARLHDRAFSDELRDALPAALARCKEEECRSACVTALGQLRRADAAGLLLQHARRGGPPALAALAALARLPRAALRPAQPALAHIAFASNHTIEVRAAALELVVWCGVGTVSELARLVRGAGGAPRELRHVLWELLRARAHEDDWLRGLLSRLPLQLRSWDALALNGTSSVLMRNTGWLLGSGPRWAGEGEGAGVGDEEQEAELQSVQVVGGGLVRRGAVRLAAGGRDLLRLRVWTTGMAALLGHADTGAGDGDTDTEPLAAGLDLAVADVDLPPITLFTGQAELLGHVWAGTGSAPTPVLRALWPRAPHSVRLVLAAGAPLELAVVSALDIAIDAHAQVSLWARTASAEVRVRCGAAGAASATVRARWGRLTARVRTQRSPRLRIAATADFYDAAAHDALCVRAHLAHYTDSRSVMLESVCGSRALTVRRWRNSSVPRVGRTLALGTRNHRACRAAPALRDHTDDTDTDTDPL